MKMFEEFPRGLVELMAFSWDLTMSSMEGFRSLVSFSDRTACFLLKP
jgi:hypothetical protein